MADEHDTDWISAELRRSAVTERAPAHLRRQIDALSARRSRTRTRPRALGPMTLVPAGGLAAIVAVLVLALSGGTPSGPTVAQAAALGARVTPSLPRVKGDGDPYPGGLTRLIQLKGVRVPRGLTPQRGWTPTGEAVDVLQGRRLLTIDYTHAGHTVAYSVAEAPLLRGQRTGFTSLEVSQRSVISWQESHHSCLLSSADVPRATLLKLARS